MHRNTRTISFLTFSTKSKPSKLRKIWELLNTYHVIHLWINNKINCDIYTSLQRQRKVVNFYLRITLMIVSKFSSRKCCVKFLTNKAKKPTWMRHKTMAPFFTKRTLFLIGFFVFGSICCNNSTISHSSTTAWICKTAL